jgi:outer membrane protein, heavy metal efflux system
MDGNRQASSHSPSRNSPVKNFSLNTASSNPATIKSESSPALKPTVVAASGLSDTGSGASNVVFAAVDPSATTEFQGALIASSGGTTVDELVNLALANNPAIKELAATTQKAAGYRTQVGLYANPIVGYQGQQLADRGTDQHLMFAEQEFATANKLQLNRRVQNEALRAQLQELEAQKLRVATDIQTLYYQALGYQKQLTLIKDFQGLMNKGYELAQLRLKASEGSKIDVLQTKVQRSEIDLVYRQTQARYDAAWREIAAITGVQAMSPTTLVSDFPVPANDMRWDDIAATLVSSSPEFAAAQARISQARAELERHGVQAIPNLTVQFGAGTDNGTNSGMMNLQVGAPIPVFNKNQGNIAAARAEYCRTLMESQRIENAIRARLAIVSRDFESSMEAVTAYGTDILPSAQEALALAETAYKAGEMDFIQLLVARRTYFESNLQYVNSQSQLAAAKAKVDGFVLSGSLDAVIDRSGSDSLRGLTFSQQ